MVIASTISKQTKSTDLGGPFTGFSAKQTLLNEKDGHQTSTRTILRNAWNTSYATGTYNGLNRKIQITGDAILHPSNGEWVLGVALVWRRPS